MSLSTLMCRDVLHAIFHRERLRPSERLVKAATPAWQQFLPDRRILVDWTAELMLTNFALPTSAHHSCVRLMDRVASAQPIQRSQLQLLGVVCVELASKLHEKPVPPEWLLAACDGQYTLHQMRALEKRVLTWLSWDLSQPTPHELASWLLADVHAQLTTQRTASPQDSIVARALEVHASLVQFASYFADLALQDPRFEEFPDTIRAASFVYNGRRAMGLPEPWSHYLSHISQCCVSDFAQCAVLLWSAHCETQPPAMQEQQFGAAASEAKIDPDVDPLRASPHNTESAFTSVEITEFEMTDPLDTE